MKADTEPQCAGERRVRSSGWSQHAGPSAAPHLPTAALRLHGQPRAGRKRRHLQGSEQGSRSRGAGEGSSGGLRRGGLCPKTLSPDAPNIDPMSPHGSTNGWHCQKRVLRPTGTDLWPLSCGFNHAKQPPATSLKKSGSELKSAESLLLTVRGQ